MQPVPPDYPEVERSSELATYQLTVPCYEYQRLLASHGVLCHMNRKGDCWDNAPTGSVFGSIKAEITEEKSLATRQAAWSVSSASSNASTIDAASTQPSATKPQPTWSNSRLRRS